MKVKFMAACPVKHPDGTWDVVTKEVEEDVPDKGRHHVICNKCPNDNYPECRKTCPVEKNYISKVSNSAGVFPAGEEK